MSDLVKRLKQFFTIRRPVIPIAAHALVGGSCVASICTQPLTWATVAQGAMAGWAAGAIISLLIIERAMKQNELTRRVIDDYGKAIDKSLQLELENFAMRQYFAANNIEFTITRDGENVSATAEYKGPDIADAVDDHARKDRTVH